MDSNKHRTTFNKNKSVYVPYNVYAGEALSEAYRQKQAKFILNSYFQFIERKDFDSSNTLARIANRIKNEEFKYLYQTIVIVKALSKIDTKDIDLSQVALPMLHKCYFAKKSPYEFANEILSKQKLSKQKEFQTEVK